AFLFLPDATVQSSIVKAGNFLIPLSQIRKSDLSDTYQLTEGILAKLTVKSTKGEASAEFQLKSDSPPLPPIKLGESVDLTIQPQSSNPNSDQYDLNGDGIINTTDYMTLLQNLGKNPKNAKADINGDGVVDQKDRDLMSQKLKE
ncbi:MAG: dockerin type I domain-containing protein, partial [Candidatus Daviesbacteria bacterium]|nr:dockerin type I domain-containing protein [Candidatus Daviesbacteria bacterium]